MPKMLKWPSKILSFHPSSIKYFPSAHTINTKVYSTPASRKTPTSFRMTVLDNIYLNQHTVFIPYSIAIKMSKIPAHEDWKVGAKVYAEIKLENGIKFLNKIELLSTHKKAKESHPKNNNRNEYKEHLDKMRAIYDKNHPQGAKKLAEADAKKAKTAGTFSSSGPSKYVKAKPDSSSVSKALSASAQASSVSASRTSSANSVAESKASTSASVASASRSASVASAKASESVSASQSASSASASVSASRSQSVASERSSASLSKARSASSVAVRESESRASSASASASHAHSLSVSASALSASRAHSLSVSSAESSASRAESVSVSTAKSASSASVAQSVSASKASSASSMQASQSASASRASSLASSSASVSASRAESVSASQSRASSARSASASRASVSVASSQSASKSVRAKSLSASVSASKSAKAASASTMDLADELIAKAANSRQAASSPSAKEPLAEHATELPKKVARDYSSASNDKNYTTYNDLSQMFNKIAKDEDWSGFDSHIIKDAAKDNDSALGDTFGHSRFDYIDHYNHIPADLGIPSVAKPKPKKPKHKPSKQEIRYRNSVDYKREKKAKAEHKKAQARKQQAKRNSKGMPDTINLNDM